MGQPVGVRVPPSAPLFKTLTKVVKSYKELRLLECGSGNHFFCGTTAGQFANLKAIIHCFQHWF